MTKFHTHDNLECLKRKNLLEAAYLTLVKGESDLMSQEEETIMALDLSFSVSASFEGIPEANMGAGRRI